MTELSKPSAPFVPTDKLETLARELFNGALPRLSGDGWKRRCQLAKEFAAAHLSIPVLPKPDAKEHAALAPAFKAIAASRQARVDAFLGTLAQPLTAKVLRDKLVTALGEKALALRLFNARHSVAAAMGLLDALEGRDTKLDLVTNHIADGGKQFLARLDAALGAGVSAKLLPQGPLRIGALNTLLDGLSDALAESKSGTGFAAVAPQKPASASAPVRAVPASKPTPKAAAPMKHDAFDSLSARAKMDFIKAGGQLAAN